MRPSISRSGRRERDMETRTRSGVASPWGKLAHALNTIAEPSDVRFWTLDPPRLACLHACHAHAVIDSRGGLRSVVLEAAVDVTAKHAARSPYSKRSKRRSSFTKSAWAFRSRVRFCTRRPTARRLLPTLPPDPGGCECKACGEERPSPCSSTLECAC